MSGRSYRNYEIAGMTLLGTLMAGLVEYAGTDGIISYIRVTEGRDAAMQLARRIDTSIDTVPKIILLAGVKGATRQYISTGGIR